MGVSTDGIVTFGVEVTEEELPPYPWPPADYVEGAEEEEDDLPTYLAKRAGAVDPWEAEPQPSEERRDAWYVAKEEAMKNSPIEIVLHCSYDFPMYIVALKGTTTKAWRGSPKELTIPFIELARIAEAKAFCEEHKIHPFHNPKWLLCSMWG